MRPFRLAARIGVALALMTSVSRSAASQAIPLDYPRPELPAGADSNSWEPYFDLGVKLLGTDYVRSQQAFEWAAHLDPSRAEPQYALWVAFWNLDIPRFNKWLSGDEKIADAPDVLHADSLRLRALYRNPFVHQGQYVALIDRLPGNFSDNDITRAWIHYGRGELPDAIRDFGRIIDHDPEKNGSLRYLRASAFVNSGMNDSALVELKKLLASKRATDSAVVGTFYESKELLDYAIALLYAQANRRDAALEAASDALVENAGFTPARDLLARYALAARDTSSATLQYDEAVRTDSTDVMLRIGFGEALLEANRPVEAVSQFRAAIRLEPFYAAGFWGLALSLEASGDVAGAEAAYKQYLQLAPRGDEHLDQARIRLKRLMGG